MCVMVSVGSHTCKKICDKFNDKSGGSCRLELSTLGLPIVNVTFTDRHMYCKIASNIRNYLEGGRERKCSVPFTVSELAVQNCSTNINRVNPCVFQALPYVPLK
jgi:hypothetical protein